MKAVIDIKNCISCGMCVGVCPEVFRMVNDSHAEVYVKEVPVQLKAKVIEAEKNCPASVITVE